MVKRISIILISFFYLGLLGCDQSDSEAKGFFDGNGPTNIGSEYNSDDQTIDQDPYSHYPTLEDSPDEFEEKWHGMVSDLTATGFAEPTACEHDPNIYCGYHYTDDVEDVTVSFSRHDSADVIDHNSQAQRDLFLRLYSRIQVKLTEMSERMDQLKLGPDSEVWQAMDAMDQVGRVSQDAIDDNQETALRVEQALSAEICVDELLAQESFQYLVKSELYLPKKCKGFSYDEDNDSDSEGYHDLEDDNDENDNYDREDDFDVDNGFDQEDDFDSDYQSREDDLDNKTKSI